MLSAIHNNPFNINMNTSNRNLKFNSFIKLITLIILLFPYSTNSVDITDNTCTFKTEGKLFSLIYLNKNKQTDHPYYQTKYSDTVSIYFNFCEPFIPEVCEQQTLQSAYAFVVNKKDSLTPQNQWKTIYYCVPYTSNSKTKNFYPLSITQNGQIRLNLTLKTAYQNNQTQRLANFILDCQDGQTEPLSNIKISNYNSTYLGISGHTPYACPLFQISSLWTALSDNKLIFGVVLFVVGFIMLFYGILMTHLMIFLAAYFLSFAVFTGIFTAFLTPQSSRVAIYFSLLFILFLSTLVAYALTRLVNVSIFFIGAFFGFILAAIVNTIFSKMFNIYSVWSLVFFQIFLTIPLGLLTFKYSQQIIILSTSLAGSYMVIRPISWIFGGFPNQFTLYQSIQNGSLTTLPWTFFIYIIIIIGVFILGVLYQIVKIQRKNNEVVQTSYLPQGMQGHLDRIHEHVQKLINKYSTENKPKQDQYTKMNEMTPIENIELKANKQDNIQPASIIKDRKSRENDF